MHLKKDTLIFRRVAHYREINWVPDAIQILYNCSLKTLETYSATSLVLTREVQIGHF